MPRRLVEFLLLFFLAAIGVNWPELPFNARLADVAFLALAVAIAFGGGLRWPRLHRLDASVAGYLLGSVVATLTSPEPRGSAVELIRHAYLVSIYVVIAAATRTGYAKTVGLGLALSGAGIAIVGLALTVITILTGFAIPGAGDIMTLPYVGSVLRLRAFTASEAMLACILALALPFAIVRASERAIHWGITSALMIAAAFLTFSHSVAGVLVGSLVAARPWLRQRRWMWRGAIAAVVFGVLLFNFAATISIRAIGSGAIRDQGDYSYGVDAGRTTVGGVEVEYAVISYFRLKEIAWDAFESHPITGAGLDRFHALTAAAYAEGRLPSHYQTTDPHSTFLGRLAETGLAGTIPLIALWIGIFITARELLRRRTDPALALALFAAMCGILVDTMNADVMNFRFLWVALGLLRGLADAPPDDDATAARP